MKFNILRTVFVGLLISFSIGCTGGSGGSGGGGGGSSNTISGKVTGPSGVISYSIKNKGSGLSTFSNAASPIAGAKVELYRTGTKGQVVGAPLVTTTADDNGDYTLLVPADVSLTNVSTMVVASDPTDDKKIYQSFVGGRSVDVGMDTNATQLSIRIALMTELQALLSEFSPAEIESLHQAAKAVLLNSNVPNFSAAYNAVRLDAGYVNLLDESADTDLSGVDFSKAPPLIFPPKIYDSAMQTTTEYKFKVGDEFNVEARALDPLNLPLEYRFKIRRNCTDVEVIQDWSSSDTLSYNFQMSDVTNCTYIVIGVRNNDGVSMDGADGDVEYEVEFTSAPSWRATSVTSQTPSVRGEHTAVWTGTRMIVWGGSTGDLLNTGGMYDPVTDIWEATSISGSVPSARKGHRAIWTGTKMIIWGGEYGPIRLNSGSLLDPSANTWQAMSSANVPTARTLHTAIWTGSKMIVWGGYDGMTGSDANALNTGGVYDPSSDTWTAMSTTNAPTGRYYHTAIWTGSKMIVWGGFRGLNGVNSGESDGGIYDPTTDSWTTMSSTGAPSARLVHQAAWTGNKLLIWGGMNPSATVQYGDGALYDIQTDTWTAMPNTDAPAGRSWGPSSVWVGDSFLVWGGYLNSGSLSSNSGGVFSVTTNRWKATTISEFTPSARAYHTAVWTGSQMIVWGGNTSVSPYSSNTGGIYSP